MISSLCYDQFNLLYEFKQMNLDPVSWNLQLALNY